MTASVPRLVDRAALVAHRARAQRAGLADFLHRIARDEIEERLKEVNRRFTAPALVSGFPEFWAPVLPFVAVSDDAPLLDLRPGAHDLVLHAMGLHWADDPVGQLIQCLRALRPDGLLLTVGFGGRTLQELRAALAEAEAEVLGGLSPRVAPMAEIRDLGGLLQRAGLALPVADSLLRKVSYAGLRPLMRDLRAMGEGNALAHRLRRPAPRRLFARTEEIYADAYGEQVDGALRLPATFELIFLAGWAPHASQQQPLRPGSAKMRLAEALGSRERPAGEAAPGGRDDTGG